MFQQQKKQFRVLNKNIYLVEQVNNSVCKSLNTPEDNSQNDLLFC